MSGYPGNGYPSSQGGYPGSPSAPLSSGYPGPPPASGGYPGPAPTQASGYPGNTPPQDGYFGAQSTNVVNLQHSAVDPSIAQWFSAVDTDHNGQICAKELQGALVNSDLSHFTEEACKLIIDMFDKKRSGALDINEFSEAFKCVNQWKATFESVDRDRNGYVEFNELNQLLQHMGYRFTPTFVQNLLVKYDHRTRKLTLDNFILACFHIKRLTDGFRVRDRAMQGQITIQYEDFVGLSMGVHQ